MDKIYYNFYKSDFYMWYVNLGVFGAKESDSVLKIITLWNYCTLLCCTVQKKYSFHKTVQYMHDIYHFHGFLGQGTHFRNQNNAQVYVLYSSVQYSYKMYSIKFFLFKKQFTTGMLYVVSKVFWVKEPISGIKITLMFM